MVVISRQLNQKDILNAQEVHFYNNNILYVVIDNDKIYGITEGSPEWFKKENFWDYFDSSYMLSYFTPITKEEAVRIYESWKKKFEKENNNINLTLGRKFCRSTRENDVVDCSNSEYEHDEKCSRASANGNRGLCNYLMP